MHVPKYRPIEPPSQPINAVMLYGRDDLAAELTNLSSFAKAILDKLHIAKRFADRRFFVTYGGLDPSTITFETFMTRFARALGVEIAGADLVFEEASASSALGDIPPVIAEIANIPGIILVPASHSKMNAANVRWIALPLDLSSAQVAPKV
ncbi:hypothetical protein BDR07DRAFT_1481193 [Suillus spraguei]|nr:hypothetical protein BDR07DRAFT_1481193 [Suillus spraguei]